MIGLYPSVQQAFGLTEDETGVSVLAVVPSGVSKGVAEGAGLVPGDVIGFVLGRSISDPILLDAVIYHSIVTDVSEFGLDAWSAGQPASYTTIISRHSLLDRD